MHDDGKMVLPVSRTSTTSSGTTVFYYPHLSLKGTNFSFVEFTEQGEQLYVESELLDFSLTQTGDHKLQGATITLRPAPQIYKMGPPGGQIAGYPIINTTHYTDLNGDSILDTMVQYTHPNTKKFILLGNQWIQVKPYRMLRRDEHPELATGLSGEKYEFSDSGWRLVPST